MRRGHWIAHRLRGRRLHRGLRAAVGGAQRRGGPSGAFPLVLLLLVAIFFPVALRRLAPVTAFGTLVILGVLLSALGPRCPR